MALTENFEAVAESVLSTKWFGWKHYLSLLQCTPFFSIHLCPLNFHCMVFSSNITHHCRILKVLVTKVRGKKVLDAFLTVLIGSLIIVFVLTFYFYSTSRD